MGLVNRDKRVMVKDLVRRSSTDVIFSGNENGGFG